MGVVGGILAVPNENGHHFHYLASEIGLNLKTIQILKS
jgi:hypothetical protein